LVSIVGMVTAILKWLYFRNVSAFYYDWLAEMCKWSDIMNNTNSSFDIFMIQTIAGLNHLIGSELASPLSKKTGTESLQLKRSYTFTDTTVPKHSSV
jgi:hypothetical protein